MKQSLIVLALGLAAGSAMAQQETGRVLSSVPVIQQVAVPRQVCSQAPAVVQRPSTGGGAVIGAVVGGLLGNTIGGGAGRAAATGVGVIAGAAVGDSVESRTQSAQVVQQCTTQTYYENRTVGYNVTYEFGGKQYQVQMPYDPGPTIRLQITPVGSAPAAPGGVSPIVTVPEVSGSVPTIIETPVAAMAAPVAVAPVVYPSYYYPSSYPYYPGGVSLSIGYSSGWGGHHHHRGHWR